MVSTSECGECGSGEGVGEGDRVNSVVWRRVGGAALDIESDANSGCTAAAWGSSSTVRSGDSKGDRAEVYVFSGLRTTSFGSPARMGDWRDGEVPVFTGDMGLEACSSEATWL